MSNGSEKNDAQLLSERIGASSVVTWANVDGVLQICSYGSDVDGTSLATAVCEALTHVTETMLASVGNPLTPDVSVQLIDTEED